MTGPRSPNPIDVHVGSRVKLRRNMMGMSQERLGEALGVTFQQVQKYEKGTNRISASRMQAMAAALDVPIGYFYEGAPLDAGDALPEPAMPMAQFAEAPAVTPFTSDLISSPEGSRLNRAFARIESAEVRQRLVDLVCAVAANQGDRGGR